MQVSVKSTVWMEMRKSVMARISRLLGELKCLSCECCLANQRSIRGTCMRCYKATLRAIAKGLTTDAERTEDGKWLSCAAPGRKPSNPVTIELSKN
jgi:hypothetical protein